MQLAHMLARRVVGSIAPVASLDRALLSLTSAQSRRVHQNLRAVDAAKGNLLSFMRSCHHFAHVPAPRPSLFCMGTFVSQVMRLTHRRGGYSGVAFRVSVTPTSLVICTSRGLVSRMMVGLLGGTVRTVSTRTSKGVRVRKQYGTTRRMLVRVGGGNPTVPSSVTSRVFVPFFAAGRKNDNVKLDVSHRVVHLSNKDVALLRNGRAGFVLGFGWMREFVIWLLTSLAVW